MCNPNGYLKISRRIFTHWIAENPEWLKWWLWILANANWTDAKKTPRDPAPLKRGQLRISQRYLQSEWARLKNGKVQSTPDTRTIWKFLETLQDDGMIKLEKRHHAETLVTVCNYDLYQDDNSTTNSTTNSTKHKNINKNNISLPPNGVRERASAPPARKDTETKAKKFIPPTEEQVTAYCAEKGYTIDPVHFFSYYTSNGWRVGRSPMKDWKAAAKTWQQKENKQQQNATTSTSRRADEEDAAKQHRYAIYEATLQRLLGS